MPRNAIPRPVFSHPAGNRLTLLAALAVLLAGPAAAQRLPFELYGPERGLTSLSIECILQDAGKVLWVGTRDGLFRYAGDRFSLYQEQQGLPTQRINALLVVGPELWVATGKGVAIWNGVGFDNPVEPDSPIAGLGVYAMAAVGNRVLLATVKGVWAARRGPDKRLDLHNVSGADPIFALFAAPDGAVWAAGDGLLRIDPAGARVGHAGDGLPTERWRGIQGTSDGSIWVRSADQLWRRPPGSAAFELAASLVRSESNFGLFQTPDGGLAVPTLNGLRLWRNGAWTVLDESRGLPASWTACAYWDHEGNAWLGLPARGLARERGQGRWLSWTTQDGLPHPSVNGVARDSRGSLWVATPDGIGRLPANGRPGLILRQKDGLPGDDAITVMADQRGSVWIGYADSGVVRIPANGPPQRLGAAEGLPSRIFALQRDAQGQIWASTRSGLFHASAAEPHPHFTRVSYAPDRPDLSTYHVDRTSDGVLWVASSDGLFRQTADGWRHFSQADGLLDHGVVFLAPGRNGDMWIGYGQRGGVARAAWRNGKLELENFSTRNGALLSDNLNFVETDARGWIWVGTHRSLELFDGENWRHFDYRSGLSGADTAQNAFYADPDGTVWIGTDAGLSQFRPPVPLPPIKAPDAVLLSASFAAPPGFRDGVPQVPWSGRAFTARFAPATFENEAFALCRYRLLGQSRDWTETADRIQTFPDLAAGNYVLELQASADRSHWSSATRFPFRIVPAWWQRWWVQLAAGSLFLLVLRAGWTLRNKGLLRQKTELELQIAERARRIVEQQRHIDREHETAERAKRAASESDRRFRSLLETVHLATLICDSEGRIAFCNDYLLRLTGWSSAEVIGRDCVDTFIAPEERDAVRARLSVRQGGDPVPDHYECSVVTRDGRRRIFQWNNTELRDETGFAGVAGIGADVTDQKQIAEQNLEAQKMESLGRLAGGVAHDFNNLLTVINGYGDMLLDHLPEDAPSRRHIIEIRKAGGRAAELTRQMLMFSRKQAIQPTSLDLNEVVRDSSEMLRRLVGEDVDLVTRLDPGLHRVMGDSTQLCQILVNLAANARDAMPKGGRLTIETGNVTLAGAASDAVPAAAPGEYVQLAVADTGIGMTEETRKHIFEPFFTLKERGRGTGLGLATVYGIVQQSRGTIRVESAPGQGSTFRVLFPEMPDGEPGSKPASPVAASADSSCAGERILVAEDETEVRNYVVEILRSLGYRVVAASSGSDALRQADALAGGIDLLLTDVVMPGMTGRELADRLRQSQPGMRVLYMSGYADEVLAPRGILDAQVAHLAKPFDPQVLAAKVREVVSRPL